MRDAMWPLRIDWVRHRALLSPAAIVLKGRDFSDAGETFGLSTLMEMFEEHFRKCTRPPYWLRHWTQKSLEWLAATQGWYQQRAGLQIAY